MDRISGTALLTGHSPGNPSAGSTVQFALLAGHSPGNPSAGSTVQFALLAVMVTALGTLDHAVAQAPERVLGTAGGAYELFTPEQVVQAGGGGSSGGDLPTPPSTGRFSLEATESAVQWTPLDTLLEEELFDEFNTGAELPGSGRHVVIGGVDSDAKRITLRSVNPPPALSDAMPQPLGTTAGAGSGTAPSRDSHVHLNPLAPYGAAGTCAKVNSTRDGIAYGTCGSATTLSDKAPRAIGTAAAGTGTAASREDHVHPHTGLTTTAVFNSTVTTLETQIKNVRRVPEPDGTNKVGEVLTLTSTSTNSENYAWEALPAVTEFPGFSTAAPLVDGTAAAGSEGKAAHGDHVHPVPDGIAQNAARSNANKNDINSLKTVQNPALAASNAGHFVRLKSDHSAYETVEPHAATLAGLPAITGQGGNVLGVNADATGLHWVAQGGGSGGSGGGAKFTLFGLSDRMPTSGSGSSSITTTFTGKGDDCLGADLLMVGLVSAGATTSNFPGTTNNFSDSRIQLPPTANQRLSGWLSIDRSSIAAGPWWVLYQITCSTDGDAKLRIQRPGNNWNNSGGFKAYLGTLSFGGGGGGGGDSPAIPKPTAAGAGEYLRVNAAGAAYELAVPVTYGGPVSEVQPVLSHQGSSGAAARSDHAHKLADNVFADASPPANGLGSPGNSVRLAREDHSHPVRTGWTQFLEGETAAKDLAGTWTIAAAVDARPPEGVRDTITEGTARLRVTLSKGTTIFAQCEITSANGGDSYGFTLSDAASMKHCTGASQAHVTVLLYDPVTSDGTQDQELDVSFDNSQSGQTFRWTVDVWIDPRSDAPVFLWEHTATGTQWATPISLPIVPATAIYARMVNTEGDGTPPFQAFRLYLFWEDTGSSPHIQRRGLVTLAGSHEHVDGAKRQEYAGQGHLHTADFTAKLAFGAGEAELGNLPTLTMTGCAFCTGGTHNIRAQLVGVP